jgi:hypothetical protein
LEKVLDHAGVLQRSERRLSGALFVEFITALLEGIESEVSATKVIVSKIESSLLESDEIGERILAASGAESARFAGITAEEVDKLRGELLRESLDSLTVESTIDEVTTQLRLSLQDLQGLEDAFARIEDAYRGIKQQIVGQSTWA